jgi:sterol desaturase/sphingolipid hydroxylase (fatty acid hydroxylase superfamily)
MRVPSARSLAVCFTIHLLFWTLAHVIAAMATTLPLCIVAICARNALVLCLLTATTSRRPRLTPVPTETFPGEFTLSFLSTSILDAAATWVSCALYSFSPPAGLVSDVVWFVPLSLMFEVVFDLGHYSTHRLLHTQGVLYRRIHSHHHTHTHPCLATTFYQHPVDMVVTNGMPMMCALWCTPGVTLRQFHVMLVFKIALEISGHVGIPLSPNHSFLQCVWLARALGIQLHAEDHETHHRLRICNFGKRFNLWDRIFGTFSPGPSHGTL